MLPIYLTLLSVSLYSGAAIIRKKISAVDEELNYAFSQLFQMLGGIFTIVFALLFGMGGEFLHFTASMTPVIVFKIVVSSILWFSSTVLTFKALHTVSASKFSIIEALSPVVSIVFALLLLNEHFSLMQFIGMVVILLAVIAVVYDKETKYSRITRSELLAIASVCLSGLALVNDKGIFLAMPTAPALTLGFFLPGVIGISLKPKEIQKVKVILGMKNVMKQLTIMSAIWSVAALLYYKAIIASNSLSLIVSVSQLSVILTVLLGFLLLKETKNWQIKIAAAIASVIGLIIMSR